MHSFRELERHFGSVPQSLLNLLTAADKAAGRQQAFADQSPQQLETLRQVARIQSAEASNAIENIRAPKKRIEELVNQTTEPKNRSEQEIAGYRYVLDTIHANAKGIDFEPKFVEQLHGYMARFTGDTTAGHWKKLDNTVEEELPDGTKRVRFEPLPADQTPDAMDELHRRFNQEFGAGDYHFLLLAAAYVFDFTAIHPFRDGNGRMSRLITLWLLYLGDYDVGRYISLEKIIEESKETYYQALGKSTQGWREGQHDLQPWVEYFLGIINAAYAELEKRTGVVAGHGSKRQLVESFIATSLNSEFSMADIRQACPGVGDAYIKQILQELKADGVVEPQGRGRGAKWKRLRSDFFDD